MTREELKAHCKKQVEACEMWARHNGEEPHGKIYEEHKLILALIERDDVLDKIRAEIIAESFPEDDEYSLSNMVYLKDVLDIIDKYKAESEG